MPGDVFNCDWILNSKAMTLTFYPGFVDQHTSIGSETYLIHVIDA